MLYTQTISLYEEYGIRKPEGSVGDLICIYQKNALSHPSNRQRPAVLILPGGGYAGTSVRESEPVAIRFVNRGYAAFVLKYSVAPQKFPTSLREAAYAMRYIREHADEMEVNPSMVTAIGFSAGGHLCGTLGTLYDGDEVCDIAPPSVIRPDALGLCYPVAVSHGYTHQPSFQNLTGNDTALTERLSIDRLVRADMPPVYLWHTRDDKTVPCRNALLLAQALDEAGVDFALHIHRHGQHGLSTADEAVYSTNQMPTTSADICGWENRMMDFFSECGIRIIDEL